MILKIKDKDVKFGFGTYYLGKALKENNTDISGLLESISKNPIADMVDLMYFSAKCEAELDDVKVPITKREFVDFLEETKDFKNDDGVLSKWSKALIESIRGNFLPEEDKEVNEVAEKKN